MRALTLLVLSATVTIACNRKPIDPGSDYTANVRLVVPSAKTLAGTLYLSKGRLGVELGPITDIFDANQGKGWRLLSDYREYMNIGWRDVSTYMPQMTDGSPCPHALQPSSCKMVDKQMLDGRPTTKWETLNQHGERIYLWTDNEAQIAVRWEIENSTYQATHLRATVARDDLFQLPPGYTPISKWPRTSF